MSSKLKEANKDKNWRDIVGKKPLDKHLKDVELLLRLFSLYGEVDRYEKPMKEFLNKSMKHHQKGDTKKVQSFLAKFPATTKFIVEALGKKPFHLRGPINTSALDSVMCVAMDNLDDLNPEEFRAQFEELVKDADFEKFTQTGTTDTKTVQDRFHLAEKYLLQE